MYTADFIVFFLVFVRIISFLGVSPIFSMKGIPNIIKIGFGFLLSFLIFNFVPYDAKLIPVSLIPLFTSAASECIFGLAMGYITTMILQAIRMSGQFMDLSVGFAMSGEFDVTNSSNVTLIGNITYLTGILIFFLIDGHHILIQTLIQTFDIVPLFGIRPSGDISGYVVMLFIRTFILAIKIASPVVIVIFITDFTMGLISRTVPQLNIMMMGLPVKVLIGLLTFSAVLPALINIFVNSFRQMPLDLKGFLKLFPMVIMFASSDKTEEPTSKKKEDAKKKGQVAKSKEFVSAVTLVGVNIIAVMFGGLTLKSLSDYLTRCLEGIKSTGFHEGSLTDGMIFSTLEFLKVTLPIFIGVIVLGIIANIVQTGFIHSNETLKPKLSRINPIEGFKRMFSGRAFVEMLKSCACIGIVGYTAYNYVKSRLPEIFKISDISGLNSLIYLPKDIIENELTKVSIIVCVIGIIDLVYQKYAYNKELKMTKQEVKEEFKQMEGDPKIKSAIRQRQREMASRRMMHEVPKANVVVTNPTHLAVAIRYKQGIDKSPIVVAKGADYIAVKIKKIASDNGIPIIENRATARILYEKVEINENIPVELYQVVAEILAMVYSLNKKKRR